MNTAHRDAKPLRNKHMDGQKNYYVTSCSFLKLIQVSRIKNQITPIDFPLRLPKILSKLACLPLARARAANC